MPALLTLHLVDIVDGVTEPAIGVSRDVRLRAGLAPEVAVPDIVVVGNADGGPVPDDVPELESELDPAGGVLGVAVGLVASKEKDIGILRPKVFEDFRARPCGPAGVAAHVGHDDHILFHRIPTDQSLE